MQTSSFQKGGLTLHTTRISRKLRSPFRLDPEDALGSSKSFFLLPLENWKQAERFSLSYLEMRIILGRLLWNFDIVSVDGAPNWNPENEMSRARAFMTWEKPDLILKVVPVKR